jgi:hypothetical protein
MSCLLARERRLLGAQRVVKELRDLRRWKLKSEKSLPQFVMERLLGEANPINSKSPND